MRFKTYLENKDIFYKKFDFERMPRLFKCYKNSLKPKPIIHIIGTNGKGSTGRFLSLLFESIGKSVGHFSSPHIFEFNERFYHGGKIASDEELERAHIRLSEIMGDDLQKISYFEYATFLMPLIFENDEFWVVEAGMGGEFDSTNVFDKALSLFTPIGLDHTNVLGKDIEAISHTKLITMDKKAILNDDMNAKSVKIAREIALNHSSNLSFASEGLNETELKNIANYADKFHLAKFQISNLTLAYSAFKSLGFSSDLSNLLPLNLRGRLEQIAPNIIIDAGHNPLGASVVKNALYPRKFVLIYNAFVDKDAKSVINELKPIIKRVEIFEYESKDRALVGESLKDMVNGVEIVKFSGLSKDEDYLVFGSFMLIEEFLRYYKDYAS